MLGRFPGVDQRCDAVRCYLAFNTPVDQLTGAYYKGTALRGSVSHHRRQPHESEGFRFSWSLRSVCPGPPGCLCGRTSRTLSLTMLATQNLRIELDFTGRSRDWSRNVYGRCRTYGTYGTYGTTWILPAKVENVSNDRKYGLDVRIYRQWCRNAREVVGFTDKSPDCSGNVSNDRKDGLKVRSTANGVGTLGKLKG